MRNVDVAAQVVALARRAGAEQCDVVVHAFDESEVTVRLGETDRLIEAGSRGLGLRVITGGRTAICSTSDFSREALERLATETVELARISAPDEFAGLPDPATLATDSGEELRLYDERIASLDVDQKIAMARACEAAGLAFDTRISNSDGATLSTRLGEIALANSLGFAAAYPVSGVSLAVEVMADDAGGKKRNAYWYSSARGLALLEQPETIGAIAARRAIGQLGSRKVTTRQVPVVFEPMMAARLLGSVAQCVSGVALYRGATFLAGKIGEAVGSPLVTITDDPLLPGRAGSRPFDGEGVTARRNEIFAGGIFGGFLFDSYTARRMAATTTGSASRGIEGGPTPSTSNLSWQPGTTSPTELVAGVRDGLYLTDLMGHGFNPATGDFSHGAAGYWIEGGELSFPVGEINVSGRLDAMLANVDAVADDVTWFGSVAAPTLRIAAMTVSGE